MGRHSGLSKEAGRISLLSGAEGVIMGGENEGSSDEIGKSWQREILFPGKVQKTEEYFVYFPFLEPQPGSKRPAVQPPTIYSEFP